MSDLAGKDYFNERQAADYCCMSYSHFRANIKTSGLKPGNVWGKKVYRKADLQRLMETEGWQQDEIPVPQSNGASTSGSQARSQRPRRLIGPKGGTSVASA